MWLITNYNEEFTAQEMGIIIIKKEGYVLHVYMNKDKKASFKKRSY